MELYYKVLKLEHIQEQAVTAYEKEYKASEPLFARRAAIMGAEEFRSELEAINIDGEEPATTVIVMLCCTPVSGFVSQLPVHFVGGNENVHLLTHHCWPVETSLYYQYGYDTGGAIATYMDVLVLPDVMEQNIDISI